MLHPHCLQDCTELAEISLEDTDFEAIRVEAALLLVLLSSAFRLANLLFSSVAPPVTPDVNPELGPGDPASFLAPGGSFLIGGVSGSGCEVVGGLEGRGGGPALSFGGVEGSCRLLSTLPPISPLPPGLLLAAVCPAC